MKNFLKSLITIVINLFIFGVIAILFLMLIFFVFTKISNIDMDSSADLVGAFYKPADDKTAIIPSLENTYSQNYEENNVNINISSVATTASPISTSNSKYYYLQLSDYEKMIYDALENNIDNLKKPQYTIDFSNKFNDLLHEPNGQDTLNKMFQTSLDAFFYDHPELFYIDLTKISMVITSKSLGPLTSYTVSLEPKNGISYLHDNFNSEELVDEAIKKVENIKNSIIQYVAAYDEYYKIQTVHDMLVNSVEYGTSNLSNNNTHNIYGTLIERKVVCEGYAKTFKYILDSLGIECILVSGTATNSSNQTQAHMWNYVKLDNKWYGVDVTWDDPIVIGGTITNSMKYNYFCKGKNAFATSHIISNKISDNGKSFSYPSISDEDYN